MWDVGVNTWARRAADGRRRAVVVVVVGRRWVEDGGWRRGRRAGGLAGWPAVAGPTDLARKAGEARLAAALAELAVADAAVRTLGDRHAADLGAMMARGSGCAAACAAWEGPEEGGKVVSIKASGLRLEREGWLSEEGAPQRRAAARRRAAAATASGGGGATRLRSHVPALPTWFASLRAVTPPWSARLVLLPA